MTVATEPTVELRPVPAAVARAIAEGRPTLNPYLRDFWRTPADIRVLYGGRASSKSWDAAGWAVFIATQCRVRVLCARQFQNKITESVYSLLKIQIERFGLRDQFEITDKYIRHPGTGSEFMFYGLARNIDEIKSLESIDILWIEEAHNLTATQWEILEPTIRGEGSQIWIIFNPRFATDFVYKRFVANPPPRTITREINYPENPFLSDKMRRTIATLRDEDYEEYQHVYLGVPRDSDDGAVIKRRWIEAAIDAHLTVTPSDGDWFGGATVGYDVADDGDDANATTGMCGAVCIDIDEWKATEDELFESAKRVKATAVRIEAGTIGYDSIGVGAGTGAHLNNLKWTRHFRFNAGAKVVKPERSYGHTRVKNKEFFANLKAQAWWDVADRFRNTFNAVAKGRQYPAEKMISLSREDLDDKMLDQLVEELSTPRRDFDNAGRVKVESKDDLKRPSRPGGAVSSPNLADSFIIANSRALLGRRSIREIL